MQRIRSSNESKKKDDKYSKRKKKEEGCDIKALCVCGATNSLEVVTVQSQWFCLQNLRSTNEIATLLNILG